MTRLALFVEFEFQWSLLWIELAFGMGSQVKISSVRDPFEFAKFSFRQERKCVLDISCATGVVAKLLLMMLSQPQSITG